MLYGHVVSMSLVVRKGHICFHRLVLVLETSLNMCRSTFEINQSLVNYNNYYILNTNGLYGYAVVDCIDLHCYLEYYLFVFLYITSSQVIDAFYCNSVLML